MYKTLIESLVQNQGVVILVVAIIAATILTIKAIPGFKHMKRQHDEQRLRAAHILKQPDYVEDAT